MHHPLIIDVILMLIGCAGFSLAAYIYHCKHQKKPLVCPLRTECDFVTTSRYSKFLGMPVELLGMCYYGAIVVLHGIVVFYPAIFNIVIARTSLVVSTAAFIFSLYLISIQAFVLRKWCTWCICSALLCAAIFLTTYLGAPVGVL